MSELTVGQLKGLTVNSNIVTVPSGHSLAVPTLLGDSSGTITIPSGQKLYAPGSIVQISTMRLDTRTSIGYSSGTILSALNISITPKFASSLLMVEWVLFYEADYNATFRICRDGNLISNSGYQGYNNTDGNRWSGVAPVLYDGDVASTPNSQLIRHYVPAYSTAATTLQVAMIQSAGASGTIHLNRSFSSSGSDNYEMGICTAMIWEIAQ
jgi:hypothetical protein